MKRLAYDALAGFWSHKKLATEFKWRWLVPIPKMEGSSINSLRPIMLIDVLCKLCTSLQIKSPPHSSATMRSSPLTMRFSTLVAPTPPTPSKLPWTNVSLFMDPAGIFRRLSTLSVNRSFASRGGVWGSLPTSLQNNGSFNSTSAARPTRPRFPYGCSH